MSVSSIDDFDPVEAYGSFSPHAASNPNLYENIFSQEMDQRPFVKNVTLRQDLLGIDYTTRSVAQENRISPKDAGGSVEVKVEASWGGKEGPQVSAGASGEVHDDNGNYVEGEIKQSSTGEGSVSVSAGHEEE